MPTLLFVYGTLRAGEPSHHLLAAAPCLAEASTDRAFELVSLGDYPAMVAGGRTAVVGELYQVDAEILARLDAFEDHPHLYRRQPIALADGRAVEAYLLPRARARGLPRIPSGDWRAP